MAFLLGLVALQSSIALAAPHGELAYRNLNIQRDIPATAEQAASDNPVIASGEPPVGPPPLSIHIGGVHTLPPGDNPFGRGFGRRDVSTPPATETSVETSQTSLSTTTPYLRHLDLRQAPPPPPHPLIIPVADAHPLMPMAVPVQQRDAQYTPPPPHITNAGAHVLQNPGIPVPKQDEVEKRADSPPTADAPYTPPPPQIINAGAHVLQSPGVPIAQRNEVGRGGNAPAAVDERLKTPVRKTSENAAAVPEPPPNARPPLHLVNGGVHTLPVQEKRIISPTPTPSTHPTFTTLWVGNSFIPITAQRQTVTTFGISTFCQPTETPPASLDSSIDNIERWCTTSTVPIVTSICAATLTPLAAPEIPITDCDQYVTFSSQYGYTPISRNNDAASTELPRDQQAIGTQTTFFAAEWTDIQPGVRPTKGIEVVCNEQSSCSTASYTPAQAFASWTPTPVQGDSKRVARPAENSTELPVWHPAVADTDSKRVARPAENSTELPAWHPAVADTDSKRVAADSTHQDNSTEFPAWHPEVADTDSKRVATDSLRQDNSTEFPEWHPEVADTDSKRVVVDEQASLPAPIPVPSDNERQQEPADKPSEVLQRRQHRR